MRQGIAADLDEEDADGVEARCRGLERPDKAMRQ